MIESTIDTGATNEKGERVEIRIAPCHRACRGYYVGLAYGDAELRRSRWIEPGKLDRYIASAKKRALKKYGVAS
jgi:hypothetical protein